MKKPNIRVRKFECFIETSDSGEQITFFENLLRRYQITKTDALAAINKWYAQPQTQSFLNSRRSSGISILGWAMLSNTLVELRILPQLTAEQRKLGIAFHRRCFHQSKDNIYGANPNPPEQVYQQGRII